MSKINVKGIKMYLYMGAPTLTTVVPTAISSANPAVVSIADVTVSAIVPGQPITFSGTGYPSLDTGDVFIVGAVDGTANTFEVLGADTTAETGPVGATPKGSVYLDGDRVQLCLSSIDIAAPSVNQVDVTTFCNEGTMPGRATLGQITMGGYVDKTSAAFDELITADEDGAERVFEIVMPGGSGYLVGALTMAGLGYVIPLEGAVSYTISGSQTQKIRYVHD